MNITERLDAIKSRSAAATPGPWTVNIEECEEHDCKCGEIFINEIERSFHSCEWGDAEDWDRDEANAVFCAAARTDIPALVAALEVAVRGLDWMAQTDAFASMTLTGIEAALNECEK